MASAGSEAAGGVLTIPGLTAAPVVADDNALGCQTDPGYKRQLGGTLLTESFFVDTAMPSGSVELCVSVTGIESVRLLVSAPGLTGVPSFTPGTFDVSPPPWPTTGPSSQCGLPFATVVTPTE
jgi:hypothetical protein